ncbi:GFA family protein [Caulobacter sp. BP25]|uniref:GFA family protein n=1 Tax=Caulobacter sp. BP25 TaxID=2048900 RepID=UPI000C129DF2|nr:GFA family protein [Caulobacter sp. BP25]PHY19233.1 aldehyde-activating protein [Caulobacter sp. BP25]
MSLSGGCQCGAVRFRVEGEPGRASICHCRMCQKAFGGPFGALVTVPVDQLTWTRGQRATFQSSETIKRGFCAACGTPLTFEWSADKIDLAVFAFDDPSVVAPVVQLAVETRPAWMEHLADMPVRPPMGPTGAVVSRQHPDFDT